MPSAFSLAITRMAYRVEIRSWSRRFPLKCQRDYLPRCSSAAPIFAKPSKRSLPRMPKLASPRLSSSHRYR